MLGGSGVFASTLDAVKMRGYVQCGVNTGLIGFAMRLRRQFLMMRQKSSLFS